MHAGLLGRANRDPVMGRGTGVVHLDSFPRPRARSGHLRGKSECVRSPCTLSSWAFRLGLPCSKTQIQAGTAFPESWGSGGEA